MNTHPPRRLLPFTKIELLVMLTFTTLVLAVLSPIIDWRQLRIWPRTPRMHNGNGIRGIHQTQAFFAQNNNTYLPGLNSSSQSTQPTTLPQTQPAQTQPQK